MRPTTLASPARTSADGTRAGAAAVWPRCAAPAPPGRPRRLSDSQLAAIDQALRQGARGHGFDTDHWTLARITRVIERLTGVGYHPGHVWKLLRHRFKWKRASMAAALCYGSHGGGAAIAFHHQVDAYNTETLIGALGQLRRFLDGQKATVLWDGLPAHRSFAMRAWLRRQRSWLVVEPLPGYAPELNPIEALWSSLKGVELANRAGDTLQRSPRQPSAASNGSATPTTWPTRSCVTAACPCGEHVPGRGEPL
jgi:hypothetical protein